MTNQQAFDTRLIDAVSYLHFVHVMIIALLYGVIWHPSMCIVIVLVYLGHWHVFTWI